MSYISTHLNKTFHKQTSYPHGHLISCTLHCFNSLRYRWQFLPVLPGPLTNWGGLLLLHYHSKVEQNPSFLWITFGIALAVFLLDYIIPALGTKKFGGTKSGVYGASIGLIVGLVVRGPCGVLAGPLCGAYVGELLHESNQKKALKSALGS